MLFKFEYEDSHSEIGFRIEILEFESNAAAWDFAMGEGALLRNFWTMDES